MWDAAGPARASKTQGTDLEPPPHALKAGLSIQSRSMLHFDFYTLRTLLDSAREHLKLLRPGLASSSQEIVIPAIKIGKPGRPPHLVQVYHYSLLL